jgi:DNA repair exonuclease SbcCD ATPase subunit
MLLRKSKVPEDIEPVQEENEKASQSQARPQAQSTQPLISPQAQARPQAGPTQSATAGLVSPSGSDMLSSRVEKLNVELQSFNELKNMYDQRFIQITEKIGELRSSLIEKERKINEIAAESDKTSDMMKSLKPETLLTEVKKGDAKIDAITSRIEADKNMVDTLKTELGSLREDVFKFRGLEEAVNLSKDLLQKVTEINKLKSAVEIDASKVTKMFMEIEKHVAEVENFKEMVNQISDTQTEISKQMDEIMILKNSFARKEDLKKFYDLIEEKLAVFKDVTDLNPETMKKFLMGVSAVNKELEEIKKSVTSKDNLSDSLNVMGDRLSALEGRLTDLQDQSLAAPKELEFLKSSILELDKKLKASQETPPPPPPPDHQPTSSTPPPAPSRNGIMGEPEFEPMPDFQVLNNAISSKNILKAEQEYQRLYAVYEKMDPINPLCDSFYDRLMGAFKRIKTIAG